MAMALLHPFPVATAAAATAP
eukprot:COSAG06_NODE_31602_length_518_cov_6.508353_1_plen_20_part_01